MECNIKQIDYEKKLLHLTGKAIGDFKLILPDDKIMIALSGGKDSITLVYLLKKLQQRAPINFELSVGMIIPDDTKDEHLNDLKKFLETLEIKFYIKRDPIFRIVSDKKKVKKSSPCFLCARMRRGSLYSLAKEIGYSKVALGHNLDDIIETFLLNLFFTGKMESMRVKQDSLNKDFNLIRPLMYIKEEYIKTFAEQMNFPVINFNCDIKNDLYKSQREEIKLYLKKLERSSPSVRGNIRKALLKGNLL